jgi:hypothetical protein
MVSITNHHTNYQTLPYIVENPKEDSAQRSKGSINGQEKGLRGPPAVPAHSNVSSSSSGRG